MCHGRRRNHEKAVVKTPFHLHDAAQQAKVVVDGPRGVVKPLAESLDLTVEGHQAEALVLDDGNGGCQLTTMVPEMRDARPRYARESLEFGNKIESFSLGRRFGGEYGANVIFGIGGASTGREDRPL